MKVLVLGTSHCGCIRDAASWIKQAYPTLGVSFYGLPGRFHAGAVQVDGIFGPAPDDKDGRASSLAWNDIEAVDMAPFDHILHIGGRFAMGDCARLLADFDILESSERLGRHVISKAACEAILSSAVSKPCERLHNLFGADARLTFTPAPYPLARSWKRGPGHERALSDLNDRPSAGLWATFYEGLISQSLSEFGYGFVAQPQSTRKAPFSTRNGYARVGEDQLAAQTNVDNRHMNTAYGREIFGAYADQILGLAPLKCDDPLDAVALEQ